MWTKQSNMVVDRLGYKTYFRTVLITIKRKRGKKCDNPAKITNEKKGIDLLHKCPQPSGPKKQVPSLLAIQNSENVVVEEKTPETFKADSRVKWTAA
ncbi:hypothetical protein YC2023_026550 [Brassica napus]